MSFRYFIFEKRSELRALWLEWRHRLDVGVNGTVVVPKSNSDTNIVNPLANNCDDGTGTTIIVDDDNIDDISDGDMNMIIV